MIINNNYLIKLLNIAIDEYNSNIELMKKHNEQTGIIEKIDEDRKEISKEDLSKLVNFVCNIDTNNVSLDTLQDLVKELPQVLENMNLMSFSLLINNSGTNEVVDLDTEFINSLNKNIRFIELSGINMSTKDSKVFSKFDKLEVIQLSNCNLSDFNIISDIDSEVGVVLEENPLEKSMKPDEIVAEIQKRKGRMMFSLESIYSNIAFAIGNNKKQVTVDNFNSRNEETMNSIKLLNKLGFNIKAIISSTSELDTKTLEETPSITEIQIIDLKNRSYEQQEVPYTRKEFLDVRKRIDEIVEKIQLPEANDIDREKKIFMQIYRMLGEGIVYNEYAITEEGRKDERLMVTCRNLYDGLIKGTSVCAGYADILKNISSEFGIRAEYISGWVKSKEEYEAEYDLQDWEMEEYDENAPGHAWNSVILDGNKYLCDLTYDASSIKAGKYPLQSCCISQEDFRIQHEEFEFLCNGEISEISDEEQLRLLGFSEEEIQEYCETSTFSLEDLQRMLDEIENRKKVADCVLGVSSDIKASDFDSISQSFSIGKEEQVNDRTN